MLRFRRLVVRSILLMSLLAVFPAANAFVIKKIQFSGLQRMTRQSMMSYISVRQGQSFTPDLSAKIIKRLYKTGYFEQINLSRRQNTLIIAVKERPTIGSLNIEGNEEIKTDQIQTVLKKLSIQDGEVFQAYKLKQFVASLQQQYKIMGYYSARVSYITKAGMRNRVFVTIKVTEGAVAEVSSITFKGNRHFTDRQLSRTFAMTTSGLFTFFTHSNRYSPTKLNADLQSLTNFYYNHGYLEFKVTSHRAVVSKDKNHVDIIVTLSEGPVYTIGTTRVIGPDSNNPAIKKLVQLPSGSVFSRQQVMNVIKSVKGYFSNRGYAKAQVVIKTQLNRVTHKVNLLFAVSEKNKIYVRRIRFIGNDHSQDLVLRNWVSQMEGSVYSQKLIDDSKQKISLLPYFQLIDVQVIPVVNKPDEVDVDFNVKPRSSGQFMVQGGYADLQKFFYTIAISQLNFMGTGKSAAISFTQSKYQQIYKVSWSNPFVTLNGLSRSFSFNYTKTEPTKLGLGNYDMSDVGAMINYGIPMSVHNTLSVGFGFDYTKISKFDSTKGAPPIQAYMSKYGSRYAQYKISAGWSYQNLNQQPFPTAGWYASVGLDMSLPFGDTVSASSKKTNAIGYYRIVLDSKYYYPLGSKGYVLNPHLTLGYGGGLGKFDSLPFFENFYGGGPNSLPGYDSSSLGPRNPNDPNNKYMGGEYGSLCRP